MKQVEPLESPEKFVDWAEDQIDSDPLQQELHEFHGYLRDDNIDSGTILGYLRAAFAFIDAEGEVIDDPEECAALRKYREFRDCADNATDGDSESK